MSKIFINKKKTNTNLIFNIILLFIILSIIFSLFYFLKSKKFSLFIANQINSFSNHYNYNFSELKIEGINHMPSIIIENYFKEYKQKSIFLVPLNKISIKIMSESWVRSVTIKSNYRNKVNVLVKEAIPIALYFNGKNYLLVDKFGSIIDFVDQTNNLDYIKFTGKKSRENISNLYMQIPNSIKPLIHSAYFIGERRWNLKMKSNIIIKLPEKKIKESFKLLIDVYDKISSIQDTEIEFIDLRIANKAIINFVE